jgi:hypothetical protein
MKYWMPALVLMYACSGCTMLSLERHTLAQTGTAVDLRYHEVLDTLALIADEPRSLPVYASIYAGTAQVTDSAQLGGTTVWQHVINQNGYGSQNANPQVSHQIGQNWTVDPIVDPEKLEAIRAACLWVTWGRERVTTDGISLLASPDQVPGMPGRHFGVMDRLATLPHGWLCMGSRKDVPARAAYKANHGSTWVWVMPNEIKGLADFSLAIQDIARVNINSPTLFNPGRNPASLTFFTADEKNAAVVTVSVDQLTHALAPDTPYYRYRLDSLGSDPYFRSQITAAGASK